VLKHTHVNEYKMQANREKNAKISVKINVNEYNIQEKEIIVCDRVDL